MSSIKSFDQSALTAANSKAMELDGESWNFFTSLCVNPFFLFVSFMLASPSSNHAFNTHALRTV